jgi:HEAT repeat protein
MFTDRPSLRFEGGISGGKMAEHPRKILEQTLRELEHANVSIRIHAAKTLFWLGSESAVAPLIEALKDLNEGVRFQAAKSLAKLTPKDFGENYDEWKLWYAKSRSV